MISTRLKRAATNVEGDDFATVLPKDPDASAAAASILMRKAAGCPVVLMRGLDWKPAEDSARALIRSREQDLFR